MEINKTVPQFKVRSNLCAGYGYINGVYYPDMSGVCNGAQPPVTPPPSTGGGYVGGVYYPDKSGTCG